MKRHLPFIIASLTCLPFCLFDLIVLLCFFMKSIVAVVPPTLERVLIYGCFLLSQWPGSALATLILASVLVIGAWRQKKKVKVELVFTSLYSLILILHAFYAIWCIITRPVFDL